MEDLETLSLFDRYNELRKINPAKDLIVRLMEITGRSEICIRMWLSTRRNPPKPLCRLISAELGIEESILFPDTKNNQTI